MRFSFNTLLLLLCLFALPSLSLSENQIIIDENNIQNLYSFQYKQKPFGCYKTSDKLIYGSLAGEATRVLIPTNINLKKLVKKIKNKYFRKEKLNLKKSLND